MKKSHRYGEVKKFYGDLLKHKAKVIYGLIDPRDNAIHYIGKTTHPVDRFYYWLNIVENDLDTVTGNPYLTTWLKSLSAAEVLPRIIVLEKLIGEVSGDLLLALEANWILKGVECDWPLTNIHRALPYRREREQGYWSDD